MVAKSDSYTGGSSAEERVDSTEPGRQQKQLLSGTGSPVGSAPAPASPQLLQVRAGPGPPAPIPGPSFPDTRQVGPQGPGLVQLSPGRPRRRSVATGAGTAECQKRWLREWLRQRAVFAVRPIANSPLVMVFAERESRGFHRILVLTPSPPELLSRRRLAHIGRSSARLHPLGFSKV